MRVTSSDIRVTSSNSRARRKSYKFKILNFNQLQKILTFFTLCWFHCLASDKPKSHTKQYGGAHISTTTWLWKISRWSLYCHHILVAGVRTHLVGGSGGGSHPKRVQLRTVGRGVTAHIYVRICTISFYVLAAFLSYSVLFYL